MEAWAKTIYIGSDHAGFEFKELLKTYLKEQFPEIALNDVGPISNARVDYPDFAKKLAKSFPTSVGEAAKTAGILICGSGQGMAMTANKFADIRAALCWDKPSAKLSRAHNDANVLCLGERLIPLGMAKNIIDTWLTTPFEGGRHADRVKKITGT
jgi:ribose 5-phosphate isomerase B